MQKFQIGIFWNVQFLPEFQTTTGCCKIKLKHIIFIFIFRLCCYKLISHRKIPLVLLQTLMQACTQNRRTEFSYILLFCCCCYFFVREHFTEDFNCPSMLNGWNLNFSGSTQLKHNWEKSSLKNEKSQTNKSFILLLINLIYIWMFTVRMSPPELAVFQCIEIRPCQSPRFISYFICLICCWINNGFKMLVTFEWL